jgi:ABC-type glycerol-3-phosphate transport system substrate-binding protein
MKSKTPIVLGFLIAAGAIVAFTVAGKQGEPPSGGAAAPTAIAAEPPPRPAATGEVTLEYSTEKREWLEAAIAEFHRTQPGIRVKLVGKGSLESAAAILDGTDQPVLWSPADSLVANLLASDWQTKHDRPLFATTGDAAPQPLLLSPLVFAVWEDRAKVLLAKAKGELTWRTIHDVVASPRGWPAIGGKPGWGFVKLGHTDPNRSNSGLQAVLLMALEYFKTQTVTVEHMLDPRFQAFVREIEAGVPRFEASTGTFMTDMIRFGPSKYDIAVVYESLAVSQLENAQGRWGSLRIYYPPVTIWSDHPIAILDGSWVTPAQKQAAAQLATFLRSTKVQATALRYGFRPADPTVPMRSSDGANPFAKLAQYGLALELPPAVPTAEGPVVRNLLMMWSRVVKR